MNSVHEELGQDRESTGKGFKTKPLKTSGFRGCGRQLLIKEAEKGWLGRQEGVRRVWHHRY